jgi:hypothetical protein
MLEEYFDKFKASMVLLVVAGVIFLAGAGASVVLLGRKSDFSCTGGGDSSDQLQKALDSVLSQYEKWQRSSDGAWRRTRVNTSRRDVYKLEDHGGSSYIVLRGTGRRNDTDESKWLVIEDWCSAQDFYQDVPKVSREGTTTTRP